MSRSVPRLRVAEADVRLPPNDLGAERAVISAVLLDPLRLGELRGLLSDADWFHPQHAAIWRAICSLADAGATIDAVTVATELRGAVSMAELADLTDATPALAHVGAHARIVAEFARRRRGIRAAQQLAVALQIGDAALASEARRALDEARRPVLRQGVSPADIVRSWRESGPLVRVPTGVGPLDELCRGGLPVPWRVMIVGAPSAGKTAFAVVIADALARQQVCVGILAIDEDVDDVTVRLGQMRGCTVAAMELRDDAVLGELGAVLTALRVRVYDSTWTVESAAADVAAWANAEKTSAALIVDSLQTVRPSAGGAALTAREHVEGVVAAIRDVSARYSMLVIATSEANRASYRSDDAARDSNDLAAGAESRSIEYGAQTQLVLRTPRADADVIHVRVAKNRRAERGEFWLRLDRDRHALTPCSDPGARAVERAPDDDGTPADAVALADLLAAHPSGLGIRELREVVRAAGLRWGRARLDAAVRLLVYRGSAEDTRSDGTRHAGPARIRLLPHDPLEDV